MQSIELEGEGPSLGVFVVIFQNVAPSHFFPFINWFLDNREVKKRQERAFACSKIALNRNDT